METYSAIPSQFVVGDTLVIDLPQGAYPSPDYSLQLVLVSSSASKLVVESTPSDGDHRLTVDTSSLSSGRYDYQLKAVGDDFRRTITSGSITGTVDFADAAVTEYDGRSFVKKMLDSLEAALLGRATKTQLKQEFDGVAIEHMSHAELTTQRDLYRCKYQKEQAAARGTSARTTIFPRFPV